MILYGYDKEQGCAIVLVDAFDVRRLLNYELDPPTKKLMEEIQEQLEKLVRKRVKIPGHERKKRTAKTKKTQKKPEKKKKKSAGEKALEKLRTMLE